MSTSPFTVHRIYDPNRRKNRWHGEIVVTDTGKLYCRTPWLASPSAVDFKAAEIIANAMEAAGQLAEAGR